MNQSDTVIRPLMRPFVLRPFAFAATPALFVAAACYFFWAPLTEAMLEFALVLPVLCAVVPALVLVERIVRYRKTEYTVRPDRILIRTGTIFKDRTIELELENITLVEWKSPYLLRKFYGAGHVTAQEAGSVAQNARLAYIEQPEVLYERIAEYMRERGFSMRRSIQVRQEQPGPVGALVDLAGRLVALIYAVAIFGVSEGADLWLLFADDVGPSVMQLVMGNYEVFSDMAFGVDVLAKMRVGVMVLGALFLLGSVLFLTLSYIDLLRRKYTLHDDVIDYEDGFLSQTRRFIPLENLADTKLTRPIHKRVLGFGDLRVSSRGAGSEIIFRSMPRGQQFASALERLLEKTGAPGLDAEQHMQHQQHQAAPRAYTVDERSSPARERTLSRRTLKQWPMRAAASALIRMVPLSLVFLVAPAIAVLSGDRFDFGPFTIASLGALSLAAVAVVGALGALGVTKQVVVALATEYSFDHQRVGETFDFLSSRQTKFSVDKITSMSVLRNPLDRLMGTMMVRLRSIGTRETIDFRHIHHDFELLVALRRALGLGQGRVGNNEPSTAQDRSYSTSTVLMPAFSVVEAIKAKAYLFVFAPIVWGLGSWLGSMLDATGWGAGGAVALTVVVSAPYFVWRGIYHKRLQARLFDDHLEVTGGVFKKFRHLAAYRHVKSVDSVCYPLSTQGRLDLATGGGFTIGIGHLPDLDSVHERIDERLSEHPPLGTKTKGAMMADTATRRLAAYAPHPLTELVRHLRFVVTLLTLPVSGVWVYLLYRRGLYRIERSRIVAEIGLVYRRRTSVLFDRIDHLETSRNAANSLFSTCDVEIYTVGSTSCDLVLRSLEHADGALEHIRGRLTHDAVDVP